MALERGPPTSGIDPGIADAPEQQQRATQMGEQLIKGLTAGDVKHRAEHAKGPWIP